MKFKVESRKSKANKLIHALSFKLLAFNSSDQGERL